MEQFKLTEKEQPEMARARDWISGMLQTAIVKMLPGMIRLL